MKAYVVHYRPLKTRRVRLSESLTRERIIGEFVDHYDRASLPSEETRIFDQRRRGWIGRRPLSKALMAITLTHLECMRRIAADDTPALVLEDDAILAEGFADKLDQCIRQLPMDWDILFVGDGCGFHIPSSLIEAGRLVYWKGREASDWGGDGATRCTDSYLLHPRCAREVLAFVERSAGSIRKPVDWWLNDVIRQLGLEVYWAEPTFVTQGSQSEYGSAY